MIKYLKGEPIILKKELELYLNTDISRYMIYIKPGVEWNGLGQGSLRRDFEKYNNVFYEEETIIYIKLIGSLRLVKILYDKNYIELNINELRNRLEQDLQYDINKTILDVHKKELIEGD